VGMTQLSSEKPALFKGRHFKHLLIIQAVRWYVTYKLSYRDVCYLMEERDVTAVHTTVDFLPIAAANCRRFFIRRNSSHLLVLPSNFDEEVIDLRSRH
jgi:hypothetical protein